MKARICFLLLAGFFCSGMHVLAAEDARASTGLEKVSSAVLQSADATSGEMDFLVVLGEQADLREAAGLTSKLEKGRFVFEKLNEVARRTQPPVVRALEKEGVAYQPFWAANMIHVRGRLPLVQRLAARVDVARIEPNPRVQFEQPIDERAARPSATNAIEANISKVRAPEAWALGYTGQGIVVGGNDTGYRWDHAALKGKYRGWDGAAADHNYNWHDSIHSGGGDCGPNTLAPCDDAGHGTHTMGIMLGDDGAGNQIGVAPGAKWIGCRCMDQGNGTPATYTECLQWFIAPTDSLGQNPDPSKAPDVINNSWSCPASEGCTDVNILQTIVANVRAAGIADRVARRFPRRRRSMTLRPPWPRPITTTPSPPSAVAARLPPMAAAVRSRIFPRPVFSFVRPIGIRSPTTNISAARAWPRRTLPARWRCCSRRIRDCAARSMPSRLCSNKPRCA